MLTLAEARRRVVDAVSQLPPSASRSIEVGRARGQRLAEDLRVIRDVPGFDGSAVDGYALRCSDLDATHVLGEDGVTLAGATHVAALEPRSCRRITTGAPLPDGADTVVMLEHTTRADIKGAGARITFTRVVERGAHVRRADDDFSAGLIAIPRGTRLDAIAIAAAVAMGHAKVQIITPPSVAVLTTGDELLPSGAPWRRGFRYDSNGPLLAGLLAEHGIECITHTHVRDDPAHLRLALAEATRSHRLVIATGGVSAGEADHLPALCSSMGEILFWRMRFRPGMPALLARVNDALVIGLPGNPVSVCATFVALVRPALAAWLECDMLDPPPRYARLTEGVSKKHDRLEWRRGRLTLDTNGNASVTPHPLTSSGALRSLLESDVLFELAADRDEFPQDTVVPMFRWHLT